MLIILLVYGILLLFWILGSGIAIYHTIEYYEPRSKMQLAVHLYIWSSVFILALSFFLIYSIDWAKPLNLGF